MHLHFCVCPSVFWHLMRSPEEPEQQMTQFWDQHHGPGCVCAAVHQSKTVCATQFFYFIVSNGELWVLEKVMISTMHSLAPLFKGEVIQRVRPCNSNTLARKRYRARAMGWPYRLAWLARLPLLISQLPLAFLSKWLPADSCLCLKCWKVQHIYDISSILVSKKNTQYILSMHGEKLSGSTITWRKT